MRVARLQNTALLDKLIWELVSSENKLWVSLLKSIYFPNGSFLAARKVNGSHVWKSIQKAYDQLQDGFRFKCGNGASSLWFDSWVTKEPLYRQVSFVDIHDRDLKIQDVFIGGQWLLQQLYTVLPEEILDLISTMQPRMVNDVADSWRWDHSVTGIYSTKSAYHTLLNRFHDVENNHNFNWIWKLTYSIFYVANLP